MTENLANTVKDWCLKNFPEETTRNLDSGQGAVIPVYRDFTGNGWLAYADIFQDKDNLRKLCEIGKIEWKRQKRFFGKYWKMSTRRSHNL